MDGDGLVDVLTSSLFPGDVRLRKNLGDWRFGPPVTRRAAPEGSFGACFIEVGDIDLDGRLDLVFPNVFSSTVAYLLNDGNLLDPRKSVKLRHLSSASKRINNARLVDLNRDGYLDIVTANHVGNAVSVFIHRGDGTFKKELLHQVGNSPAIIVFGDLNSDGWNDIIALNWQEDFITVLMNRGDGHLLQGKEYKVGSASHGIDTGNLNGDGHVDL